MNPDLVRRFLRRFAFVAPFIVALFAFRVREDWKNGESLASIVFLNAVPLLLVGTVLTGMLWWLSQPVEGVVDAEAAIEMRRASGMRKAATVSIVVHLILAAGALAAFLAR